MQSGGNSNVDDPRTTANAVQRPHAAGTAPSRRHRVIRPQPAEGVIGGGDSTRSQGAGEVGPVPLPVWRTEPVGNVRHEAGRPQWHPGAVPSYRVANAGAAHLRTPPES